MSVLIHASVGEDKILQSIDEGMNVFGISVKNVIYWRFQTIYNSRREDVLKKPELFSECLRTFFGERAFNVEAAIVGSIAANLSIASLQPSDSLARAINEARKSSASES